MKNSAEARAKPETSPSEKAPNLTSTIDGTSVIDAGRMTKEGMLIPKTDDE